MKNRCTRACMYLISERFSAMGTFRFTEGICCYICCENMFAKCFAKYVEHILQNMFEHIFENMF